MSCFLVTRRNSHSQKNNPETRLMNVCLEKLIEYLKHCPQIMPHNSRPLTKAQQRRHNAFNQGWLWPDITSFLFFFAKESCFFFFVVIVQILQGLYEMRADQLSTHLKEFYCLLSDLVCADSIGMFILIFRKHPKQKSQVTCQRCHFNP